LTSALPSLDLSIVIVSWNTCELLAGCLSSVADQTKHSSELRIETSVVDNASTDGSAAMVRGQFPWVQLIENPRNAGFARANNQGIREARGPLILLLNPDTVLRPEALAALVSFMNGHARAGAAGARLLNADGSLQVSCHPMLTPEREFWRLSFLDALWPRASYPMAGWNTTTPRRVEAIKGACLLLRRDALDQVGPLDDAYFMYTEEVDLCYRLAKAGWELWWVPDAEVVHFGAASSKRSAGEMYLQLYRSKMQFYRKFGGEGQARRFARLVRLAYVPRWAAAALGGLVSPTMAGRAATYRSLLAELPGM
jgi:N-acetylglucosaminyl-diphospho-decaprenol L-rhamnosyltransferase